MKNFLNFFKIVIVFLVAVIPVFSISCSGNNNASIDLDTAVGRVVNEAMELTVKSNDNGEKATIKKENPDFSTIVAYFSNYAPERTQPRFYEIDNKRTEVKIPYVLNYVLTFKINGGGDLTFDYGYDKIWFTTDDMIYAGSVDISLNDVLVRSLK